MDQSMLFLLMGKDSPWLPYLLIFMVIFQKWEQIENYLKRLVSFGKTQYEISAQYYTCKTDAYTYGDLPFNVSAVLNEINIMIKKNKNVSKAINIKLPQGDMLEGDTISIPSYRDRVLLTDGIECMVSMSIRESNVKDEHRDGKNLNIEETNIKITFFSNKKVDEIIDYIDKLTVDFKEKKEAHNNKEIFICKFSKSKNSSKNAPDLDFANRIPFNSSKTFDNLFFEGKDELIHRLDMFKNRSKYKSLGLPETLGLLLYGEPGTGKTSAIKAIANYMKMSLIIVPMNIIKTKTALEDLFFNDNLCTIKNDRRIYVFEEIDCNGWEGIVRDRRYVGKDVKQETSHEMSALDKLADKINGVDSKKKEDESDKLTLGAILEVIDGLVETPGRMIIMTTNHRDFLDPALIRPGRIDMEIEFKKLRRGHIQQIYEKWYKMPMDLGMANQIPDYKFTQAEVSQLLFKHEKHPGGFVKEIIKTAL